MKQNNKNIKLYKDRNVIVSSSNKITVILMGGKTKERRKNLFLSYLIISDVNASCESTVFREIEVSSWST